jgi:hypothetical protein
LQRQGEKLPIGICRGTINQAVICDNRPSNECWTRLMLKFWILTDVPLVYNIAY